MIIGPNFGNELIAAGLGGCPLTWAADGSIFNREKLTANQETKLQTVIAAHNPAQPSTQAALDAAFASDIDRQALVAVVAAATPAQIKTYINNNVVDLASARLMLIRLALLVARLTKS